MKAIEQYFQVVLLIVLYNRVLTFKFVDETLVCDYSNKSYWAVLSCGTVNYAVQCGSNLSIWMKPKYMTIKVKIFEHYQLIL